MLRQFFLIISVLQTLKINSPVELQCMIKSLHLVKENAVEIIWNLRR